MSDDGTTELFEQLEDENPRVRIRAIRRLEARAELTAVPELAGIYSSEDQPAAVRKAARETLGVFKAIQVAIQNNQDVVLPDPDTVKEPTVSPDFLRRLLRILFIFLLLIVALDVGIFLAKDRGMFQPVIAGPPAVARYLQETVDQLRVDVANQEQAWRQYAAIQTLGCDRFAPPAESSINTRRLEDLQIEQASQAALFHARAKVASAVTQFVPVSNNWNLGCANQPLDQSVDSFEVLRRVTVELDQAQAALDQAHAALATSTPLPEDGGDVTVQTATPQGIPVTLPPTLEPTPLALDYGPYIRAMRERIDTALVGRGMVAQLNQYWQDVRDTGRSFGCNQVLTDAGIQNYYGVTAETGALDSRLLDIQIAINVGMTLARESLANFQQGCAAGNFSTLVGIGQPQAQQAAAALQQAGQMLDQLQAEVSPR